MSAQLQISSAATGSNLVVVQAFVRKETLLTVKLPPVGTLLKQFPTALISSSPIYGNYLFKGAVDIGRGEDETFTKLTFIPTSDPSPNDPFSTEDEYDPITNDLWRVTRRVSVSDGSTQSLWNVTTGKQMENGLWINTTRMLTTQNVSTTREQSNEFQEILKTSQYIAQPSAPISALGYTIENNYDPKFAYFGLQTKSTFSGPITKTDTEFDPETYDPITVTRTLTTTAVTTETAGHDVTCHQISQGLYLVTTRSIAGGGGGGLPTSLALPTFVPYQIPTLLNALNVNGYVRSDGATIVKVDPVRRAYREMDVEATRIIDYFTTPPSRSSLWQLLPTDIVYQGFLFNIPPLQRVLTDAINISVTTASGDPNFPSATESYSASATTPSVTDYMAAVSAAVGGTQQLIKEDVKPWRYHIFRREQIWISPV